MVRWSRSSDGEREALLVSLPSRPIFAFAGVWRPTGDGPAYAFLTTGYDGDPGTHLVGAIHPKAMPVILHEEVYDRWLAAPVENASSLAGSYPSQLMIRL